MVFHLERLVLAPKPPWRLAVGGCWSIERYLLIESPLVLLPLGLLAVMLYLHDMSQNAVLAQVHSGLISVRSTYPHPVLLLPRWIEKAYLGSPSSTSLVILFITALLKW